MIDKGIPCTARTTLNNHSSTDINCVQEKRETTGVCYEEARKTFEVHAPLPGLGECVVG